jgi:hypothetical protein
MFKSILRRLLALCVSIVMLGLMQSGAVAWGGPGHRIIVRVAMWRLEQLHADNASNKVKKILGNFNDNYINAVTWPDTVRYAGPKYDYADDWHFVDIRKNDTQYNAQLDCGQKVTTRKDNKQVGQCLVEGLRYTRGVLADETYDPELRYEALKYILHFMGDMHQPLHCATDNDGGGNGKYVCFFGQCFDPSKDKAPRNKNLHSMWDSYMIARQMQLKWPNQNNQWEVLYARMLEEKIQTLSASELAAIESDDPKNQIVAWVNESHMLARDRAYKLPSAPVTKYNPYDQQSYKYYVVGNNDDYYKNNIVVVDEQLMKAGLRLAAYLRQIFPG